jgi:hypothetical protein
MERMKQYINQQFRRAFGDGREVFLTDGRLCNVVTRVLDKFGNVEIVATCKDAATAALIAELLDQVREGADQDEDSVWSSPHDPSTCATCCAFDEAQRKISKKKNAA